MGLGVVVTCVWGAFDLFVFKVILGHSVHLSKNGLELEKSWS